MLAVPMQSHVTGSYNFLCPLSVLSNAVKNGAGIWKTGEHAFLE
jgi:hypothetical protein